MKDDELDRLVEEILENMKPLPHNLKKIKARRKANLWILFHLFLYFWRNRDLRFHQAIASLKLKSANDGEWNEESVVTLDKIKKTIANKSR